MERKVEPDDQITGDDGITERAAILPSITGVGGHDRRDLRSKLVGGRLLQPGP
jgi:hypothetical protein